jgi:hypothetical protein
MPRRIDFGRAVLVAGAALLLISLFLEWYDTGPTGWEVFEALDLILAAIALAGVATAARPDLAPPWAGWALPGAAVAIVAVQLVNAPPAAADASPSTGAWIALAASLLMGVGAALSLSDISVTVQVGERDPRRRVAAVDRRAAATDQAAEEVEDDARSGRLGPRRTPATAGAADDIERTQPLPAGEQAEEGREGP